MEISKSHYILSYKILFSLNDNKYLIYARKGNTNGQINLPHLCHLQEGEQISQRITTSNNPNLNHSKHNHSQSNKYNTNTSPHLHNHPTIFQNNQHRNLTSNLQKLTNSRNNPPIYLRPHSSQSLMNPRLLMTTVTNLNPLTMLHPRLQFHNNPIHRYCPVLIRNR